MDSIDDPKFELSIGGIGRFKRDRGDIICVNADKSKTLLSIYYNLCRQLNEKGFNLQDRDYKPHITLARNAMLTGDLGLVCAPNIKTTINRISLMKSEQIEGRLTYTEIYAKELEQMGGND